MTSITESLAIAAIERRPVRCTFSDAKKHSRTCICRGTMRVRACGPCEGSGWNRNLGRACPCCGGSGAYSASREPKP